MNALSLVDSLPERNRLIVIYVVRFLQVGKEWGEMCARMIALVLQYLKHQNAPKNVKLKVVAIVTG